MSAKKEFELSAGNLVIGTFTIAFIVLPEGWTTKVGAAPPEVDYTTKIGNIGWVLQGQARYYLVNLIQGDVLELEVKCKKRRGKLSATNLIADPNQGIVEVAGHRATIQKRSMHTGILRKKEFKEMKLIIPCDVTGRVLEMRFTSPSDSTGIEDASSLIHLYRCH